LGDGGGAGRARGRLAAAGIIDGLRRDLEPTQAKRENTLYQDPIQLKKFIPINFSKRRSNLAKHQMR
jgi:hypothetical protein